MIYRFASRQDIPNMETLWCSTFGDSRAYVQQFYAHWFDRAVFCIALDNERLVGISHMLPMTIRNGTTERCGKYLYACAVHPEYRQHGIFGTLLKRLHEIGDAENAEFLLVPAKDALIPYYEKFGYRITPFFSVELYTALPRTADSQAEMCELTAEDYCRLRNKRLQTIPDAIEWDFDALHYALQEIRNSGGFAKKIILPEGECALLGYTDKDTVHLREITALPAMRERFIKAAGGFFSEKQITCRLPFSDGTAIRNGMVRRAAGTVQDAYYFPIDYL